MIYIWMCMISIVIYKILDSTQVPKKLTMLVSFLPLFIVGAIRKDVGTDYIGYSYYQIPITLHDLDGKVEALSRLIIKLGYFLSGETTYIYIFSLFHILFMFFVMKAIEEGSKNGAYSIFLLVISTYFNFSLSGMRQALATSIIMYGLIFLKKNKYFYYILTVVIATLIHESAIIYILFLVLYLLKMDMLLGIVVVLGTFILKYAGENVIELLMQETGFYEEYIGSEFFTGETTRLYQYYGIAIAIIVILISIIYKKIIPKEMKIYNSIAYILLFVSINNTYFPTPYRIILMFLPFYIVVLPNYIGYISNVRIRFFVYSMFTILTIVVYSIGILDYNRFSTLPYKTFFD